MGSAPSALSLIAAIMYCAVAAAAMLAQTRAVIRRQVVWHRWGWALVAVLFVGLALLRVFSVEDWIRGDLRAVFYEQQSYESRRSVQAPLFASLFLLSAGMFAWLFYTIRQGIAGRRNVTVIVGLGCAGGMILLFSLRIVSLHSVDALLYGPLKLNWVFDIGLSATVLASAIRYRSVVQRELG